MRVSFLPRLGHRDKSVGKRKLCLVHMAVSCECHEKEQLVMSGPWDLPDYLGKSLCADVIAGAQWAPRDL